MTSTSTKTTVTGQYSGGVVLHGYHRKLKTMKNKYFVLYEDCGKSLARLEYFDNEKKFKSKTSPKRSIILNSCFNINRRLDTKHEFVITLSTKDGAFGIVMETEEEMNEWLKAMLKLQSGQNIFSGPPRPYYEHVWQVIVQRKGLAEKKGILGNYHVCLSSKSVTLIRIGLDRTNLGESRVPVIEFYLTSIRRCGDSKCYFYMEVGRHSVVGAGELWMETKDSLIAQNMHTMILNVMSTNADDPYGPMRKRSSSATETSKPVTILQRRQTHSGSKTMNSSPLSVPNRDRCDSLPSSRNRTNTESGYNSFTNTSMPPSRTMSSLNTVPNSIYNRHSHSPPMNSNALSPSVGCSESDGSTLSIDEPDSMKHSLTPDENSGFASRFYNSRSPGGVILEENSDEFWYTENKKQNCIENALILDKLNTEAVSLNQGTADDAESQYMDMFNSISPCETAQCDTTLAGAEYPFKSCNDSSDGNSRASSIAEEIADGYVHMSPQTSDYVDMEQSMKSRRQIFNINLSSTRSIIPEVPVKDMSFTEYPFEKVNSRIFEEEDETQLLNERPLRAYSVGSRMEHNNQKLRIEVITNSDQNNCRVRAFSVGSRSKVPRCDLQRNVLLTNANSCNSNNANINHSKSSIASMEPVSESSARGRKSSSAPLLIHKSQNSVDRMDDLMEIDFSKNAGSRSNSLSSQSAGTSSYLMNLPKASHIRSGVLSSSPGKNSINNKLHDTFTAPMPFKPDYGYLEMRPVIYLHSPGNYDESTDNMSVSNDSSFPDLSEITTIRPQQQQQDPTHNKLKMVDEWNKMETPEGYLEMSWSSNKDNNNGPDQLSATNNRQQFVNENSNTYAKSRSPSTLMDIKKTRGVPKMPSITQSLINNRTLANSNNSKLSYLHTQNQITQFNQKSALNVLAESESESSQSKRLSDNTISEEKSPNADQDATISDKFNNLFIKRSLPPTDVPSSVQVDLSNPDTVCYDYLKFAAAKPSSEKKTESDAGVDCQLTNQYIENTSRRDSPDINCKNKGCKSNSSNSETDSLLDEAKKFARKSSSPKCTPTSPYSPPLRSVQHFGKTNRQPKGTWYELSHNRSDSSLQTRKSISRPSSVNSDRIFHPETIQCRPNSVDGGEPVSSSAATLCFSSSSSSSVCDNRSQDHQTNKHPYTDDNRQKSTDSASSSKGLQQQQHIDPTTNPASKIVALCQPSPNTELELHYASLDLPISSTKNSNATIYGSCNNPARSSTSDDTATTSLSPNSNTSQQQSAFTYAKIDFNQCESKKFKCGTQNNL